MCHLLLQKWCFTPSGLLGKRQRFIHDFITLFITQFCCYSQVLHGPCLMSIVPSMPLSSVISPLSTLAETFSLQLSHSLHFFIPLCCVPQLNLSLELHSQSKSCFVHSIQKVQWVPSESHLSQCVCVCVCVCEKSLNIQKSEKPEMLILTPIYLPPGINKCKHLIQILF